MKLLTKSTIYLAVTSFIVFLVGGITVYYLLQSLISEEVDEGLAEKKSDFRWDLKDAKGFDNFILPKDSTLIISPKIEDKVSPLPAYGDTLLYDEIEDELKPFRYIKFLVTYNNESRFVTIYQSLIETDDLVEGIVISLLVVFVIMIAAISILNAFGMRHVWRPFQKILEQIKLFDFRKNKKFKSIKTDISEFADLNNELTKMTIKLTRDYQSLKEFSENASHEMQTPLAIIQSKLELLFQKEDMGEDNLKAVNSAYQAVNRLSKLHHELNLLTRIENQEYKDLDSIDLKSFLQNQVENFRDILELKNIKLNTSFLSDLKVRANTYLLEILFSNLFSNAIKHNLSEAGEINVELTEKTCIISNTGKEPEYALDTLFERFKKGKPGAESTGLGLALVRQICSVHGFNISYSYQNSLHILKVDF